jgi:hypothetical protein
MEYTIEPWTRGRWVIVAEGKRKLAICDSREQAERLLMEMIAREKAAGENGQETGRENRV